jgi:hypothetical protein
MIARDNNMTDTLKAIAVMAMRMTGLEKRYSFLPINRFAMKRAIFIKY